MTHQQKLTLETRLWRAGIILSFSVFGFFFAKLYTRIDTAYDAAVNQVPVNAAFHEYHRMHFDAFGRMEVKMADMTKDYYMLSAKIQRP
jgi:hypothetical protein